MSLPLGPSPVQIADSAHQIKFGTDGWRGIIAEDFTFENVRICAQALCDDMRTTGAARRGLVVGYDTRFGSSRFAAAVAEVAAANEIEVSLLSSPTPTPAASFAVTHRNAGAGVVITASHNPGAYNGFKVKSSVGGSAAPEAIARLESNIAAVITRASPVRRTPLAEAESAGTVATLDISEPFLEQVARLADIASIRRSRLKIVVDAMFGAGGGYLPRILAGGNVDVEEINGDPNPAFPGITQPEPIASNLAQLSALVRQSGADVGLALDGDADRLGVVDENGRYLTTLQVFPLLAHHLLRGRGERGPIVCTITMSSMVDRLGDEYAIDIHRTAVGFKYVGPKMLETDAMLGGEESGGYAFRGHSPERDGILSALIFLEGMVASGKRPSELVEDLEAATGPHTFRRSDLEFEGPRRAEIEARVADAEPDEIGGLQVVEIDRRDGVWFRLEGGAWAILRFSGTEPLLRMYAEARDQARVERLLADLNALAGL